MGQSQDGEAVGCGVRISSQLGHLPSTGGGPWRPKGMGGTPESLGRTWREGEGRRSGGGTGPAPLRGGWERGGVPTPGGAHSQQQDQQGWGENLGGSED